MTRRRAMPLAFWTGLAVALVSALAFLPALRNGWAWDDELNFLNNPFYRGLGWAQLRWMFTTAYLGPYQPLTWLSAALDHAAWGMDPLGYHLTNLVLHGGAAASFYVLARRLLRLGAPGASEGPALEACAAAAALLFAAHPLRVEAVAWATERRTLLCALFWLWAVWWHLEAAGRAEGAGRARAMTALLFVLSLLSKGIGIGLPFTLLALDFYPLRRLDADPRRWGGEPSRRALREKWPLLLAAALFAAVELSGYSRLPVGLAPVPEGAAGPRPLLRLAKAAYALCYYPLKTALPLRLTPTWGLPPWNGPLDGPLPWACAAALLAGAYAWRERERRPWLLAGAVHYLFALAPVLGLLKFADHAVADRYSYLATLPLPLLAGAGLWSLSREAEPRRRAFAPALAGAFAAAALLAALSWRQAGYWRSSITLWERAASLQPDSFPVRRQLSLAYYNLGNLRMRQDRLRDAWRAYDRSLQLDPRNALTHVNIGVIMLRSNAAEEAAARFRLALDLDPRHPFALNGLGMAQMRLGRTKEAAASLCAALAVAPELDGVRRNLEALLAHEPGLRAKLDASCLEELARPSRGPSAGPSGAPR